MTACGDDFLAKLRSLSRKAFVFPVFLAAVALGGCAFEGQDMDNPAVRRFVWFSYAGGEDIKKSCALGAPDQYRIIYNGFWRDQVRTYDLKKEGDGTALLDQRILSGLSFRLFSTSDMMAPFRGDVATRALSSADYAQLLASMKQSGVFDPPPVGLRLPSDGYYWTVVGCHEGRFVFNAWLYPDQGFKSLTFPAALMKLDETGVPFQEPDPSSLILRYSERELFEDRWWMVVREDGF